jgi:hypothetical protein
VVARNMTAVTVFLNTSAYNEYIQHLKNTSGLTMGRGTD